MTTNSPDVEILHLETPNPEKPPATAACSPPAPRCQHRFPNGTQCRFRGPDLQSGLCLRHFREKFVAALPSSPSDSEDLSADLLPEPTDFSYGEDVQKFLARLVVQVTKGRVSPRRAAVLGYLTNQLLHSHRAVEHELHPPGQQDRESHTMILDIDSAVTRRALEAQKAQRACDSERVFDLPRPNRD